MDAQIKTVQQEIENVQLLMIAIERKPGENEAIRLMEDANSGLMKTETHIFQLESQISREPAKVRQHIYVRLQQLKGDFRLLRSSLSTMQKRLENRRKREKEREELLRKRYTTNAETRINLGIDHELCVHEKLSFSDQMLDQLIVQSAKVYEDLQNQKQNLLNIRKRFNFLTKSLGISDATLRVIGKRVREDKILFFIGVVFCLLFMFSFYYWWCY